MQPYCNDEKSHKATSNQTERKEEADCDRSIFYAFPKEKMRGRMKVNAPPTFSKMTKAFLQATTKSSLDTNNNEEGTKEDCLSRNGNTLYNNHGEIFKQGEEHPISICAAIHNFDK
eukprot:15332327-Ditylum_brightwellii.AAC.1